MVEEMRSLMDGHYSLIGSQLNSAKVGGILNVNDSTFLSDLKMDKVKISSSLFMKNSRFVETHDEPTKTVLTAAEIDGNVHMSGSEFGKELALELENEGYASWVDDKGA